MQVAMEQPKVTRRDIVQGLRRLGLAGGEVVLAHSSLSRFGHVEDGAVTVIDALREAIAPSGTLLMSALTITPEFVAAHVRAAREGRIDRQWPVFDAGATATWAGRIAETFRHIPGVGRSWHPSHSVTALGPMADRLLADHHLRPACGPGSPYEQVSRLDEGRILLMGVSHDSNTTLHGLEELAGLEYAVHPETCRIPIRTPRGEDLAVTRLHVYFIERELGRLESRYISTGAEMVTRIGAAPVRLCHARAMREVTLEALARDPWTLVTPRGRRAWAKMKATGNFLEPPNIDE